MSQKFLALGLGFGKSFLHLLPAIFLSGDATVTIAHRCTPMEQLKELTSLADIIIAAAGNQKKKSFAIINWFITVVPDSH